MADNSASLVRKWYFCINEAGFDGYFPLVVAAVASARANTDLQPFCLYGGTDDHHVAQLTALGVTVIRHIPSFDADLRLGYGDDYPRFVGHWLRVDLPLVDPTDDLVIYTDFDILFQAHPTCDRIPVTIGAGPEFDRGNLAYFSSGVMLVNLRGLRRVHPAFVSDIRDRLRGDFTYPAHDQKSFNQFFRRSLGNTIRHRAFHRIAAENNWKPFWGANPDTTILHFHGPKPWDIRLFMKGQETGTDPHRRMLQDLWKTEPEAYAQALADWDRHYAAGLLMMGKT